MFKYLLLFLFLYSCCPENGCPDNEKQEQEVLNSMVNNFEIKQGIRVGSSSCMPSLISGNSCSAVLNDVPVNYYCIVGYGCKWDK